MRLIVMQFVTLDGVSQGPGAPDEDTSGGFALGGWLVPHMDDTFLQQVVTWCSTADAFLFGRRTYENFARDFPPQTDPDDPFAGPMNRLPKYVASRTLRHVTWEPTTVLDGDVEARVAALKAGPGRELQIHGSSELAGGLIAAGLVDELRLVVAPVVLGTGRRLFADRAAPVGLRLTDCVATPSGLCLQTYTYSGAPQFGSYGGT